MVGASILRRCVRPRMALSLLIWAALIWAAAVPAAISLLGLSPDKTIWQFTHTSWSANEGIPGPVTAIAQTRDGYLWFGTHAGLYRFDGQKFASWEVEGSNARLPRSAISSLLAARDGSLWIGFKSNGVSRLKDAEVKNYTPADGLHSGGVLSIVEAGRGVIWAGGASGFSRFVDGRWMRVGRELGYPAPGARQLVVDRRGTLWAATDEYNFGLNKDSVRVNTILKLRAGAFQFEPTGQPVGYVAQLAEAPDGAIWMVEASDPGPTVRRVDTPSNALIEREARGAPLCVLFGRAGDMWFGLLRGGLRRVNHFTRFEQSSIERFASEDGLSSDGVRAAFKDREGNLWFGTNRGVDRFRGNKVTHLVTRDGLLSDPHMVLVSSSDGKTWIVNSPLDLVQWFDNGSLLRRKLPAYSASDSTRLVTAYSNGADTWLGGSFGLARRVDGDRFSFLSVPGIRIGTLVEAITADAAGDLWVALWHGDRSTFMRRHGATWTDFAGRPDLPANRCRVLYGDGQGRVWFGFATGEVLVEENGKFRRYTSADGLPPGKILAISSDRRGNIWVGGEGGLSQFRQSRFVTLTKENGLPGSAISAVVEDLSGCLWIAGELGIARLSAKEVEMAFTVPSYRMHTLFLDTADGLPGLPAQEENFPSATRSPDGRLWFATTDGIALIDPLHIPMNTLPPNVAIQSVTAGDRPVSIARAIHFGSSERNIQIGFAALSFSIPERVRYRYKLEGYDQDWRGPFSARTAAYTNLPPRPYHFRVVASNEDGVWNTTGATLDFEIAPLFYETKWFQAACAGIALTALWMLYQWRFRFVTARLDLRYAERLSERERIARELHDTLLQSIQGLMLRFQSVAKVIPIREPARAALEKALDRADDVMAEGRARVTLLRSFYGECPDLSEALSAVAKEYAGPLHPAFRVVVEGAPRSLHPLARDEVYSIGREAILNALRHAHSDELEAELCYSAKELRLRIQDNGCGIADEILGAGGRASHWGLRGMTERAEKMGALLSIRSKHGAGTEVELKVPGVVAYGNGWKKPNRHEYPDDFR
jgi:signal transduction histidine kinase/ligand-binding sensor domain-containing protein